MAEATLQRHSVNKNKYALGDKKHTDRLTVLSHEQEEDLVQQVVGIEEMLFGVSKPTGQEIAFDMASRNHVPLQFTRSNQKRKKQGQIDSDILWKGISNDPWKSVARTLNYYRS